MSSETLHQQTRTALWKLRRKKWEEEKFECLLVNIFYKGEKVVDKIVAKIIITFSRKKANVYTKTKYRPAINDIYKIYTQSGAFTNLVCSL